MGEKISIRCVFNIYTNHLHLLFEVLFVANSPFLHACAIIIYGVDAVVEKLCDLGTVVDAEADERKDTDRGAELPVFLHAQLGLGSEQCVDVFDKVGKEMDEGRVKAFVEFAGVFIVALLAVKDTFQFHILFVFEIACRAFLDLVDAVDVEAAQFEELPDVFFFDTITVGESYVAVGESRVVSCKLALLW